MNTVLWIAQTGLVATFAVTGLTKVVQPREQMAAGMMGWAAGVTDAQFRAIGMLELLGAAGLVLPELLGVATVLTPLAAAGLALTMAGAFATHLRLGEVGRAVVPLAMLAIALFVAVERFGAHTL